ncbi:MAG: hypothetical protein AAF958_02430 [Planctomycetota bacterium]
MKKTLCAIVLAATALLPSPASAQNPILLDAYGRGVHSFYSGRTQEASQSLSAAVNGGLQDPRAYYYLGMVASQRGNQYEAENYWRQGAQLEAEGKIVGSIGRALTRFQGRGRIKLEEIRRKAKLDYLAIAAAKSRQRFGEIQAAESSVLRNPAAAAPPMAPPAPPVAAKPFDEKSPADAAVEKPDAFPDSMNDPFGDEPPAPGADAPLAPAADPFNQPSPAADTSPFGTTGDADPFGGADAGNPFGS